MRPASSEESALFFVVIPKGTFNRQPQSIRHIHCHSEPFACLWRTCEESAVAFAFVAQMFAFKNVCGFSARRLSPPPSVAHCHSEERFGRREAAACDEESAFALHCHPEPFACLWRTCEESAVAFVFVAQMFAFKNVCGFSARRLSPPPSVAHCHSEERFGRREAAACDEESAFALRCHSEAALSTASPNRSAISTVIPNRSHAFGERVRNLLLLSFS
jgi:hypothetical protein